MKKEVKSKGDYKKIKITEDGPYLISGKIPLSKMVIVADKNGDPIKWKKEKTKFKLSGGYLLCRCGKSKNKPFCDQAHIKVKFKGKETANTNEKYSTGMDSINGPSLILYDKEKLCSGAGFCHRKSGAWDLTKQSNLAICKKIAIEEACACPSGRLIAVNKKTKKPYETIFTPSIVLIEHPDHAVSGPLAVRGNISIESVNGKEYEKRNRVTLCRCGKSKNKPFCDSTHIDINFKDNK